MNLQQLRGGFSSTFWIANTLELFERLAFYGAKAVLVVFIAEKVGLTEYAGKLAGIFSAVIWALPVFAGVLVDKYGFKKTLVACFAIFCLGYFLIGLGGLEVAQPFVESVGKFNYMLAVLLLTAVGGSLIKPCIVGTVAKTTTKDVKSLGFSIYYSLVNLGGAIGPIVAMYVREGLGIEFVLIMSSVTSFLMCISALLFFKEPIAVEQEDATTTQEPKTLWRVFFDMGTVLSNARFMLFLVIFSGFWIMFWPIFYLMPFYVKDILKFAKFELLESVDAACIILLTVPLTALAKKLKPITAMTLGFLIASFCWIVIGAWSTMTATVIGIALFAVGEAIQAPRFYEYVASLAPKDQVGTFMGFAFLPVAIGSLTAGFVSDWLRLSYIDTNPSMMWFVLAGIGLISTILMTLYNVFLTPTSSTADPQVH
jgi:proton-dependent oligopeptide transporter, POT family